MPQAKERKETENNRKEKQVIPLAKARAKTRKAKVWQLVTLAGSPDILLETVGETTIIFDRLQVASDTAHSSSGEASVTTHTNCLQQTNGAQQSSSAGTKPVVRRIENSEPVIFDLRERHDDAESPVIHFYIGDDDDDDDDDERRV